MVVASVLSLIFGPSGKPPANPTELRWKLNGPCISPPFYATVIRFSQRGPPSQPSNRSKAKVSPPTLKLPPHRFGAKNTPQCQPVVGNRHGKPSHIPFHPAPRSRASRARPPARRPRGHRMNPEIRFFVPRFTSADSSFGATCPILASHCCFFYPRKYGRLLFFSTEGQQEGNLFLPITGPWGAF